jgi:hypothetical protein
VKQSDLGMKEMQEKQNIQYTGKNTSSPSNQGKSQAPPQTKVNHKLPLKPSHGDGNTKFQLKRVARKV